jgi:uncharacterized protein (DUF924 family)
MDISRSKEILDYWFSKGLYNPDYDKWFMKSQDYDEEIKEKFGELLKEAEKGKGFGWLVSKDSFVAYIILMDQFSRHIYRGKSNAFKNDNGVMIFCELGFEVYKKELIGYEFMFAFMPYMHTENLKLQKKGCELYEEQILLYEKSGYRNVTKPIITALISSIIPTNYDKEYQMLKSMRIHVEGHFNTILRFGRFPKRNIALERISTISEIDYMEDPEVKKRPY